MSAQECVLLCVYLHEGNCVSGSEGMFMLYEGSCISDKENACQRENLQERESGPKNAPCRNPPEPGLLNQTEPEIFTPNIFYITPTLLKCYVLFCDDLMKKTPTNVAIKSYVLVQNITEKQYCKLVFQKD